jgi:hypothetical protein
MPASTSNWEKLMGRNSWTMDFATLSEDYFILPPCAGSLMYSVMICFLKITFYYHLHSNDLVSFFRRNLDVVDIPELFPSEYQSSCCFPCFDKGECISSVEWIRYLKKKRKLLDA